MKVKHFQTFIENLLPTDGTKLPNNNTKFNAKLCIIATMKSIFLSGFLAEIDNLTESFTEI